MTRPNGDDAKRQLAGDRCRARGRPRRLLIAISRRPLSGGPGGGHRARLSGQGRQRRAGRPDLRGGLLLHGHFAISVLQHLYLGRGVTVTAQSRPCIIGG
jgi:hypothetical protein